MPAATPPAPGPDRAHLGALDALRGVAALLVVFHHVWLLGLLTPGEKWQWRLLRYSPLRMVADGRAPVILFFVLSGFVLAHGLLQAPLGYRAFLVRRLTRIYLPFAAAITLSAAAYWWFEPGPVRPLNAWFGAFWRAGHNPATVLRHLLMPGDRQDDLDPVVWSLVHELRVSALLPALLWAARRSFPACLLGAVLLHVAGLPFGVDAGTGRACADWWTCKPFWGPSLAGSLMVSACFVVFFVLGVGIALHRDRLRHTLAGMSLAGRLAALLVSGGLLSGVLLPNDFSYGVGAAGVITLTLEERRISRVLNWRPLLWLGTHSYSLYLVHLPVFLVVVYASGTVGAAAIPLLLAAALLAAALFHRAVEAPSRDWGRRLATRRARAVSDAQPRRAPARRPFSAAAPSPP